MDNYKREWEKKEVSGFLSQNTFSLLMSELLHYSFSLHFKNYIKITIKSFFAVHFFEFL